MSTLNVSCPLGGNFYACGSGTRFVGCCLSNPCANGCPAGNLVPSAFDHTQYGTFSDQQCNAGDFYTCIYPNNSTFLGCCTQSACAAWNSCPDGSLAGAYLSDNPTEADDFLALNTTWSDQTLTSVPSTASSSYLSTSAVSAAVSGAAYSSSAEASQGSAVNIGAIVGGTVGGLAVLVILILGTFGLLRRRRDGLPTREKSTRQALPDYSYEQSAGLIDQYAKPRMMSPEQYGIYRDQSTPQPLYSSPVPPFLPGYAAEVEAIPSRQLSELTADEPVGLGIGSLRKGASSAGSENQGER